VNGKAPRPWPGSPFQSEHLLTAGEVRVEHGAGDERRDDRSRETGNHRVPPSPVPGALGTADGA